MARYAKKETLTTVMFVGELSWNGPTVTSCQHLQPLTLHAVPSAAVFTLSWFVTRITIFPAFIIRSCIYEAHVRFKHTRLSSAAIYCPALPNCVQQAQ